MLTSSARLDSTRTQAASTQIPAAVSFASSAEPADEHALLEVRLETGRTHQIRVHLKSIGHPLLGDRTYGWKPDPKLPLPLRVMLHAERIAFLHPVTARPLDLRAPLPPDFADLLRVLRHMSTIS